MTNVCSDGSSSIRGVPAPQIMERVLQRRVDQIIDVPVSEAVKEIVQIIPRKSASRNNSGLESKCG